MKTPFLLGAAALAFALTGCGGGDEGNLSANTGNNAAPLTQIAAPNGGDWTEIVTQTPEGGIRMGNPDAPVKLIEYASLTCPHCRDFTAAASETLRNTYVRSGQVSWEFRNFIMNAPDVAMSMLARCQPNSAFFRTVDQLFEQQTELMGNIDEAEQQRLQPLAPDQMIAPLARAMELDAFFARRGMPEARFNECLANRQSAEQLTRMLEQATQEGVNSTPTFVINGDRLEDVADWAGLEPRLRTAIGS